MGTYTEFKFTAIFKDDIPDIVKSTLLNMYNNFYFTEIPDHPQFKTDRWKMLFHGISAGCFDIENSEFVIDKNCKINIHSSLKNYDKEINKFIDWVSPYLLAKDGDILGYYLHEDHDNKTFIMYNNGKIVELDQP